MTHAPRLNHAGRRTTSPSITGTALSLPNRNGAITPLSGLDTDRFEKAQQMIVDLKLNDLHHMVGRLVRLKMMEAGIPDDPREGTQRSEALRRRFASRGSDLSTLARVWLTERGYSIDE